MIAVCLEGPDHERGGEGELNFREKGPKCKSTCAIKYKYPTLGSCVVMQEASKRESPGLVSNGLSQINMW